MRTIISSFEGRSKSVKVGTYGKSVRALSLLLGAVVLAGLPGCLSFGGGGDSDTKASKNASETAIYREVAEMVKLYRLCLQKNEDNPVKARESCGMYKDAIRDLAPDNMRTIVGEVLDRLRDRVRSHRIGTIANHKMGPIGTDDPTTRSVLEGIHAQQEEQTEDLSSLLPVSGSHSRVMTQVVGATKKSQAIFH